MEKAVFFDRDGVLNVDIDYISRVDEFELLPDAGLMVNMVRQLGYKTFVVTNQPIVARGMITEEELVNLHKSLQSLLLEQNSNAVIDEFLYCPCHPHATLEEYRRNCENRKPKPGMILQLAQKHNIDLTKSYMIGDRISDVIAGHLAGCKTIQCLTGKHTEAPITSDLVLDKPIEPDYIISDLLEIEGIIL